MDMGSSSAGRLGQKSTAERNRRIRVKMLCSQLCALLPPPSTTTGRGSVSLPHRLDEAVTYIRGLQARIEKAEKRRQLLWEAAGSSRGRMTLPHIEVQDLVAGLQVIITSSPGDWFVFNEAIRVVEAEGAEIVNASFSASGDKAYHVINLHVGEPKSGEEARYLLGRLKEDMHMLF